MGKDEMVDTNHRDYNNGCSTCSINLSLKFCNIHEEEEEKEEVVLKIPKGHEAHENTNIYMTWS